VAAGALLLFLIGCGEQVLTVPKPVAPPPAPRDIPEIPPAFAESQFAHSKVRGLTMRIYDTGSAVVPGSEISSIKSSSARSKLSVPVFLIKHPTQGYILFDTGIGAASGMKSDCLNAPIDVAKGQDIISQLNADGVSLGQIKYVILSHLHREHAGAAVGFAGATVIVDRREWAAQKERQKTKPDRDAVDPARLEPLVNLRLVDLSARQAFGAFDHGLDLFDDGTIILVDLSGHTAGSLGAWVNLDSGPVLLAGDATWLLDNHQDRAIPQKRYIADLENYWRRIYEMRAMQEAAPRLLIIPGHDLEVLNLQPHPDATLVPPR
jgi:glyoxylase-like metal-dependent hydrolase (beta-lactamase superfamily II)